MEHQVSTRHIQKLIRNALGLAELVDGVKESYSVTLDLALHRDGVQTVPSALEKAISDLRHAADELETERLSCRGWAQV